jgi:hypothetical protein
VTSTDDDVRYCLASLGLTPAWSVWGQDYGGAIIIPDGSWSLYAESTDPAGNRAVVGPFDFRVDTTVPDIEWSIEPESPDGENGWYVSAPEVEIRTSDPETTLYYRSSGESSWMQYFGMFTLEDGVTSLEFRAQNEHGTSTGAQSGDIMVDTTPPDVAITAPAGDEILGPDDLAVEWTGTDVLSGSPEYESRLDSYAWAGHGSDTRVTLSALSDGLHRVTVRVTDSAGNTETASMEFVVDATTPEVKSHTPEGTGVSVSSDIVIRFTEDMDEDGVDIHVTGASGELTWKGRKATFSPDGDLPFDTVIQVRLTGSDVVGNAMEEYEWSFTTEADPAAGEPDEKRDAEDTEPEGALPEGVFAGMMTALLVVITGGLAGITIIWRRHEKECRPLFRKE